MYSNYNHNKHAQLHVHVPCKLCLLIIIAAMKELCAKYSTSVYENAAWRCMKTLSFAIVTVYSGHGYGIDFARGVKYTGIQLANVRK